MITRELIDNALAGDDYSCGMIYALTNGNPVKLTDIGEDVATAVSEAHERALRRLAAYEARSADFAEHARLIEARLDRANRRASFMSDKISMDEAREKARLDRDRQDPTDYESEWQPARNGAFEAYLETSAALADHEDDEPTLPEILAACREGRADLAEERRKINNRAAREIANIIDAPVANAADPGAPRVP